MKKMLSIVLLFMITLHFNSCDDIDIISPRGPAGMSAFEDWVKAVKEGTIPWTAGTDLPNFFKFLKGEKGDTGLDGASALDTWREYIKSGTVPNPHKPGSNWDPAKNTQPDFYYFLTGAKGDAGLTPRINEKGNWQIGTIDTGIPAKGKDGVNGSDGSDGKDGVNGSDGKDGVNGSDGKDGVNGSDGQDGVNGSNGKDGSVVSISIVTGNWEIDEIDTGIPSRGDTGAAGLPGINGSDGQSALSIWVDEVMNGNIYDKDGQLWSKDKTSLNDFWNYLSGGSAIAKEITILQYLSSVIDPIDVTKHVFSFKTDPGAKVVMVFEHKKVTAIADANGDCSIKFENSQEGITPVLAYAELVGIKTISANLLLKVPVRPSFFKFSDTATWILFNGEVHQGNGVSIYGEYDISAKPRFFTFNYTQGVSSAEIEFESVNVKDILIINGVTNNFVISYEWNASHTAGVIRLQRPTGSWSPSLNGEVVNFQIVSPSGTVFFESLRVKSVS